MNTKKIEYVQSAYNGGFPVANGDGFVHGEPVYVVSKEYLHYLENIAKEKKANHDRRRDRSPAK